MIEQKIKGWGYTHIYSAVWSEIGKPTTPDEWHKALLLPDDYEITDITRDKCNFYRLRLESALIPASDIETVVQLYYCKNDGVAMFDRVELIHWDGKRWT